MEFAKIGQEIVDKEILKVNEFMPIQMEVSYCVKKIVCIQRGNIGEY